MYIQTTIWLNMCKRGLHPSLIGCSLAGFVNWRLRCGFKLSCFCIIEGGSISGQTFDIDGKETWHPYISTNTNYERRKDTSNSPFFNAPQDPTVLSIYLKRFYQKKYIYLKRSWNSCPFCHLHLVVVSYYLLVQFIGMNHLWQRFHVQVNEIRLQENTWDLI